MKLRNLKTTDVANKTILYRAPYDIDTIEVDGVFQVSDDLRISATIPTLEFLIKQNCKIVILTYVGRPDGQIVEKLRTNPHAQRLSQLLGKSVEKVDDCIGDEVLSKIKNMKPQDVLMLENVRFHSEEMVDDDNFSKELCEGKDLIVFDGFPQAHRKHASTTGIERYLPAVAGFYLEEEVKMLSELLENPKKPFTVIIGGAKISDKVDAVRNLLNIADTFLIGGAVSNVFLKAEGRGLGNSFVEDVFVDKTKREKKDWVEDAKSILNQAKLLGKKVVLPSDVVVSDGKETKIINILKENVPDGWMALDIGEETVKNFSEITKNSKTIFINGPLGKTNDINFIKGSVDIVNIMKESGGETIIAGGDTIDFVRKYGKLENYTHVSLAGGATLEFLAGKELPALKALE
jgi:phosphoglycerate kinase